MKFRVVTFADGKASWMKAAKRLAREASGVPRLSRLDIANLSSGLLGRQFAAEVPSHWLVSNRRGNGYWIWKPYLIREALLNLSHDEAGVLYLDAGCTLNVTQKSLTALDTYADMAIETGSFFFELQDQADKKWTKIDLIDHFGTEGKRFAETNQRLSTVHFWTPTDRNFMLLERWIELAKMQDFHFLDDSKSIMAEQPEFIEHRHDQSIFSLVTKHMGISSFADQTWHHPDWLQSGINFPIWATRHQSGVPFKVTARVIKFRLGR